ncbi:MAG: TRAP transporter large permease [Desulfobacteraceae bacterium]|nr:MAG: TRAP transporter large permease [Desulfobacteraceae bacterium]
MVSMGVLVVFLGTLVVGIPIAFSLYFTSLVMLISMKIPAMIMVQRVIGGIEKYPLLCVPFFILAGSMMSAGGITQRLIHFSNLLVGRFRGALGLINVLTSMFFAGISGSAVADATSLGSILIPAMKKEGYDPDFSAAITASSAVCGPIIPPSIPMVILGIVCSMPIGRLFLAGAFPGILLGLSLLLGAYIAAVRNNYPKHDPAPIKDIVKGLRQSASALAMPFIVVGGIASGAVTDAELGVLAALYALIVGVFFHRELTVKKISECLKDTVLSTGIVLFILGTASLFSWLLAVSGIPQVIVKSIFALTDNPVLIILLIILLLLAIGTIMDGVAAILLLAPILLPMSSRIGMDPLHFGVMIVFALMLGLLTPPIGITLIISAKFAQISLLRATKAVLPYFAIGVIVLLIIAFCPWFSLYLPNLVFGH